MSTRQRQPFTYFVFNSTFVGKWQDGYHNSCNKPTVIPKEWTRHTHITGLNFLKTCMQSLTTTFHHN